MQKILELSEKHFLTGIAPSSQVQDKGLFHKAKGITVALDTFMESNSLGLLSAGPALTNLTGSVIKDRPYAWAVDIEDLTHEYLYIWGDNGYLYRLNMLGNSVVELNALASVGAMTNGANGLFLINHTAGAKRLYYWRDTGLGYYGDILGTPSFNNSAYTTGVVTTPHHPTVRLFDRNFFGNGRYVGHAYDEGSTNALVFDATALDLEKTYTVTSLSDDGSNLVIGATTSTTTDSFARGSAKIFFWDTESSSWQREWTIPDAVIYSIQKVGSTNIAITTRGLWAFTFNSKPEQLIPYTPTAHVPSPSYPAHNAADVISSAVLWGGSDRIVSFGKLNPALPNALLEPISGFSASGFAATMVCASAKTGQVYIGTEESKLFTASLGTFVPTTGVSAETIFLDLQKWWQVGKIVVEFSAQLASGDSFAISVQPDDATASSTWGTATYADSGAIRTKELYGSKEARKLKLIPTFTGGAVKVRRIEVWGDPITTPTHTRV